MTTTSRARATSRHLRLRRTPPGTSSELGRGGPIGATGSATPPSPSVKTWRPPADAFSVLVVDDAQTDCRLLGAWLDTTGAQWETAQDAASALAALARRAFDVVVLDVDLGDGPSGFDLLAKLAGPVERRELDVIVVSSSGRTPDTLARGFALGAERCIAKPIERARFLAAMEDLRDRAAERLSLRTTTATSAPRPAVLAPSPTPGAGLPCAGGPDGELVATGAVVPRAEALGPGAAPSVAVDVFTENGELWVAMLDVGAAVGLLEPARAAIRDAIRAGLSEADVPRVLDRALDEEVGVALVRQASGSGALGMVTRGLPPFVVVAPGQSPLVVPPSGHDPRRTVLLAPGAVLVGFTSAMIGTAVDLVTLMDRLGAPRFGSSLAEATAAQVAAVALQARPAFARRDAGVVFVGRQALP